MPLCRVRLAFLVLVLHLNSAIAYAERVATIVANSNYDTPGWDLDNPVRDAALMKQSLEEVGFDVQVVTDANEDEMEQAFLQHANRLKRAGSDSVGFFFFAGHGIQSRGLNYLIPTDIRAVTEQDVWAQAPRLGLLFDLVEDAGNDTNFIVLDACRNNPLPSTFRSAERGLVAEGRVRGTLIAYSTAPGTVAEDGTRSTNSPFASALSAYIRQPGLSAESMFRLVATSVEDQTSFRQQPWVESGLRGRDFCFAGCQAPRVVEANPEVVELQAAWASEDIEAMKDFIKKFPLSSSRSLFEAKIAELSESKSNGPVAGRSEVAIDSNESELQNFGSSRLSGLSRATTSPDIQDSNDIGTVVSINTDFGFLVLQLNKQVPTGATVYVEGKSGARFRATIARVAGTGKYSATLQSKGSLSSISPGMKVVEK